MDERFSFRLVFPCIMFVVQEFGCVSGLQKVSIFRDDAYRDGERRRIETENLRYVIVGTSKMKVPHRLYCLFK
jgi:hypothetical protein